MRWHLLAVFSKVCERVALDQFSDYLSFNIMVSDYILEAMDKKRLDCAYFIRPFQSF